MDTTKLGESAGKKQHGRFLGYALIPCLSVLVECCFPSIFLYCRNAQEAYPAEMLPFMAIFLATAVLVMLITAPFFRNVSREAFFADIVMLFVVNFTMVADSVERRIPWLWSRYQLVLAAVVLLALFILLLRKKPDLRIGCLLVLIAFASITVMNVVIAIPSIYKSFQIAKPEVEPETETGIVLEEPHVNAYLFLMDEYGGYENLKHYFDYDNSPFLDALADRGFTVTKECRNGESVYSNTIISNLLNLDYKMKVGDYGVLTKYYMNNSYLVRIFQQNGYKINLVNHHNFVGTSNCNVLTSGQTKSSLSKYMLENSIFYKITPIRRWLTVQLRVSSSDTALAQLEDALDAGLRCAEAAQPGPTFTIGYYESPHSPLMLAADGSQNYRRQYYDWRNPDNYLGQLEFMSEYTLQVVDTILASDPDALIILQSDHGCRYPMHEIQVGVSDWYDPEQENLYMQNILNCVYYKGETFEIEGTTGINTLRRVLNQVYGTEFEDLEPVYNYANYSEYLRKNKGE